jgi:hypothetical protein
MADKFMESRDAAFDDSASITRQVDMFTEHMQVDGAVYVGLGSAIGQINTPNLRVQGVIHLRMTPKFARELAERLLDGAAKAEQQTRDMLAALDHRRAGTAN